MKILLDECLPVGLRLHLPTHAVHSSRWAGFTGMKNGNLLAAAEAAGYQVLLTTDREIPYQQNLKDRSISIVILRSPTNDLRDLVVLVPAILTALETIQPGQVLTVPNN